MQIFKVTGQSLQMDKSFQKLYSNPTLSINLKSVFINISVLFCIYLVAQSSKTPESAGPAEIL